jgi:inorganic pyrophosphatase
MARLDRLPPDDDEFVRVVIESPQGARHKLKFDPAAGSFELKKTLPAGMAFPFDFGFVPGTKAADGDPLDVLVLMDAPTYPGVIVRVRLIGVIEAEQADHGGEAYRNDRLIAVADGSTSRGDLRGMSDLDDALVGQIEAFFVTYCALTDKEFRPVGRGGRRAAAATLARARAG